MFSLGLLLALALGPSKALGPLGSHARGPRLAAPATLAMDIAWTVPVADATSQVEILGARLADGIVLDGVHLGLDGQPAMPFLGTFLYAQEIRITQIDPVALAGSVMVTARASF